jgi:hypothetical protein
MPSAVAAQNIGLGPCWWEARGDVLAAMARITPSQPNEAMARITPSQPNEAMARVAPRRNGTISLDPSCRVKIPEQGPLDSIRNCSC